MPFKRRLLFLALSSIIFYISIKIFKTAAAEITRTFNRASKDASKGASVQWSIVLCLVQPMKPILQGSQLTTTRGAFTEASAKSPLGMITTCVPVEPLAPGYCSKVPHPFHKWPAQWED
jgi:hypothetical protein